VWLRDRVVCLRDRVVCLRDRVVCMRDRVVCLRDRVVCMRARMTQVRQVCGRVRYVCASARCLVFGPVFAAENRNRHAGEESFPKTRPSAALRNNPFRRAKLASRWSGGWRWPV
jgi:hypothetical protein